MFEPYEEHAFCRTAESSLAYWCQDHRVYLNDPEES